MSVLRYDRSTAQSMRNSSILRGTTRLWKFSVSPSVRAPEVPAALVGGEDWGDDFPFFSLEPLVLPDFEPGESLLPPEESLEGSFFFLPNIPREREKEKREREKRNERVREREK